MEVSGQLHAAAASPLKIRDPSIHSTGGQVDPTADLDAWENLIPVQN